MVGRSSVLQSLQVHTSRDAYYYYYRIMYVLVSASSSKPLDTAASNVAGA